MANVLGTISLLDTPDVNGVLLLTASTGLTSISGTTSEILVSGSVPALTIGLATDVVLPGTGSVTTPVGTTAQRPVTPSQGMIRMNTTLGQLETYNGTYWSHVNRVLQIVSGSIAAGSGTTTVPLDSTVPTNTEGWQIWTTSFTPISATSRIVIKFSITTSHSAGTGTNICSVFAGATNIGSAAGRTDSAANTAVNISLSVVHSPGSISAITFSARLGNPTAGTSYCNLIGANTLGGTLVSEYTITEIQ